VSVSRSPGQKGGSHVLAYADERGATEEHALCGTPEEICSKLTALSDAGAEYVLLTVLGGKGQLRRFAQEVMPAFSAALDGEMRCAGGWLRCQVADYLRRWEDVGYSGHVRARVERPGVKETARSIVQSHWRAEKGQ
jgi:hypothetical protein